MGSDGDLLFCLLELPSIRSSHNAGHLVSTFYDLGLAIFMLWFLNTSSIRNWLHHSTGVLPPPRPQC